MDCVFVGAGDIAHEYASDMAGSELSLKAVCDLKRDRATSLVAEFGGEPYTDLESMLDDESAPLLLNLTNHASHAPVTRTGLEHDRHVFSQKPLALEAAEAYDLVRTAEQRGLSLGCAPCSTTRPAQRRAVVGLTDGRVGDVRVIYAHAHVGRVTEWHDTPASFLEVGPLYDGAVYPLTLLVSWYGPITRIRVASASDAWPARESQRPSGPSHFEAVLETAAGPVVRLTASFYVPHRSREFNSLEFHGDDGSLYLQDTGAMDDGTSLVQFGRQGREYVPMPPQYPSRRRGFAEGPVRLAHSVKTGEQNVESGYRAAHIVAICNAIERAVKKGRAVDVPHIEEAPEAEPRVAPDWQPSLDDSGAVRLPRIGFGCSRYRAGTYVDRRESIATALDAGYRLFDSAELYGNEERIGELLARPGAPDRSAIHLTSKVWNTNHGHLAEACRTTLDALGVDVLDTYLLHWPDAWVYQGPLYRLAELPPEEQETLTFPRDDDGEIREADVALTETWRSMGDLVTEGLVRAIGICNIGLDRLKPLLECGERSPAVVQVEAHPYEPRQELVDFCNARGIRVIAHTPLGPSELLTDPTVREVADELGASPAQTVLAWNVNRGVVPIPASNSAEHLVENLEAASIQLSPDQQDRINQLGEEAT